MISNRKLACLALLCLMLALSSCRGRVYTLSELQASKSLLNEVAVFEVAPQGYISIGSAPYSNNSTAKGVETLARGRALREAKTNLIHFLKNSESNVSAEAEFTGGRILREGLVGETFRVAYYVENIMLKAN